MLSCFGVLAPCVKLERFESSHRLQLAAQTQAFDASNDQRGRHRSASGILRVGNAWMDQRRKSTVLVLCGGIVLAIGVLDSLLGSMIQLSIFYLFPVGIGAWFGSRRIGLSLALCAGVLSVGVEMLSVAPAAPLVVAWNVGARMLLMVLATVLLARMRVQLAREHRLAQTDALTGVLNRRAFWNVLAREAERARRYRLPVSVLYLDLDDFKQLNDSLGHEEGDRALCEIARVLSASCRASDSVARLGGDEFAILCPEADERAAAAVAQKVYAAVHDALQRSANTTASIGVTTFTTVPEDLGLLMRGADRSMYLAKHAGKDQVHYMVWRDQQTSSP